MRRGWRLRSVEAIHPLPVLRVVRFAPDFVILAADPLEAPEGDISGIEVVETWVNGVRVYAG